MYIENFRYIRTYFARKKQCQNYRKLRIMTRNISKWFQGRRFEMGNCEQSVVKEVTFKIFKEILYDTFEDKFKYTVLCFGTHCLIVHFRMTGKIVPYQEERKHRVLFVSKCLESEIEQDTYIFVDTRSQEKGTSFPSTKNHNFFQNRSRALAPKKISGKRLQSIFRQKRKHP